jgi:hypothetical protein
MFGWLVLIGSAPLKMNSTPALLASIIDNSPASPRLNTFQKRLHPAVR